MRGEGKAEQCVCIAAHDPTALLLCCRSPTAGWLCADCWCWMVLVSGLSCRHTAAQSSPVTAFPLCSAHPRAPPTTLTDSATRGHRTALLLHPTVASPQRHGHPGRAHVSPPHLPPHLLSPGRPQLSSLPPALQPM